MVILTNEQIKKFEYVVNSLSKNSHLINESLCNYNHNNIKINLFESR